MAGFISALGKAGAQGQNSVSSALDRESAARRATTDEDHYVSALQRVSHAVDQGIINGANKDEVSAFVQNQYLLNKTGGKRDLGDQYVTRGLSSQLGAEDGINKYALAGVLPKQVGDASVFFGAGADDATYVKDTEGNVMLDENGKPLIKNVEGGGTNENLVMFKPDFDMRKQQAKDDGEKATSTLAELDYKKVADGTFKTAFTAGEEDTQNKFMEKIVVDKKLIAAIAAGKELTGVEKTSNDEQVSLLKKRKSELDADTQDKMSSLKKRGFEYSEDTGTLTYKAGTGRMKWKNAKNNTENYPVSMEEEYDPATGQSKVYFTFEEIDSKGNKVPNRLDAAQMRDFVQEKAGANSANVYERFHRDFKFSKSKTEESRNKVKQYDQHIRSAFQDNNVTRKEAEELLGSKVAKLLWDETEKTRGAAIQQIDVETFKRRVSEMQQYNEEYGKIAPGDNRKGIISAMIHGTDVEDSKKAETEINAEAARKKDKVYRAALEYNNNITKETVRVAVNNLLTEAQNFVGQNAEYPVSIKPNATIVVTMKSGKPVEFTQEELLKEKNRDVLTALLKRNDEIISRKRK